MIRQYTIGDSSQHWSTYFEYLRRDCRTTPKALRQLGIYQDLPYSRLAQSMINNRIRIERVRGSGRREIFIAALGPTVEMRFDSVVPSDGDVIAKLGEKWRNTDLNIGVLLSAEGRESIDTLSSALKRLTNSAISLRRGDFGGFVRNMHELPRKHRKEAYNRFNQGDLSGAFLSAHLGWTPMIRDAYEAANIDPPKLRADRIRATKAGKPRTWYVNSPGPFVDSFVQEGKLSVTLIGDISRPATWQERFGMGNFFEVVWENVPLSFVADYFLPIGQTISNMYFISQARFSRLWIKRYEDSLATMKTKVGLVYNDGGEPWRTASSATVRRRYRSFSRSTYELNFASPLRSMKVNMPSSLMRLATLGALTHQSLLSLDKR